MAAGAAAAAPDWAHLPPVAVQAISAACRGCPASRATLRAICLPWYEALAATFGTLHVGPGSPAWLSARGGGGCGAPAAHQHSSPSQQLHAGLRRAFPAITAVHLTASSSRDYEPTYTQDLALLLASQPAVTRLQLTERHELAHFETLDPASLWDVLSAARPVLQGRLRVLAVAGCFWNTPELFGGLRQLTRLTDLRLANTPLETAYELGVVASMTQLVHLELGIIFDGSSSQHDVPRALADFAALQRLQVLKVPMWRRSLGGRAHPLAPALSSALQHLTRLTSLSVDGKFSQLCVVASLSGLQELASAAPMSQEGWQAVCKLSQLTLLTSLTPPHEPLQLSARPHPGCDLAALSCKASLRGMDVAVLQPEHLAAVGQFTALQQLNLRCAAMFTRGRQQGQLLTALGCLPGGLTRLVLGPLLPLCPQLFASIGRSCPSLQELHARFSHVAAAACQAAASAAAAADTDMLDDSKPASEAAAAAAMDEDQQPSAGTISSALGRLQRLHTLELALAAGEGGADSAGLMLSPSRRRSSSYGGALGAGSSSSQAGAMAAAAAAHEAGAAAAAAASGSPEPSDAAMPCFPADTCGGVVLQLECLPSRLRRLALSGPWRLTLDAAVAAAAVKLAADAPAGPPPPQQQQQGKQCSRCRGRMPSPPAAVDSDAAAVQEDAAAAALCSCFEALNILQLPAGDAPTASHPQRQQHSSSSSLQGSPTRPPSGLKRPGSYSPAYTPPRAADASGVSSILSQVPQQAAADGDVIMLSDRPEALHKRSRSYTTLAAQQQQQQRVAPAAGGEPRAASADGGSSARPLLPELAALSLHQCRLAYTTLAALVAASRQQLSSLRLLQLAVLPPASAAAEQQQAVSAPFLTAEQLLALPVRWSCLQQWAIHPYQLWGMVQLRCMAGGGGGALRQLGSAVELTTTLRHVSQLISLRQLLVSDSAAALADGQIAAEEQQQEQEHAAHMAQLPVAALPLHDPGAVHRLLDALRAGMQCLPALRQLVLHLGPVAQQLPQLQDATPHLWGPAGEQLLGVLPTVSVQYASPRVVPAAAQRLLVPVTGDGTPTTLLSGQEVAAQPLHAWQEPEYVI